MNQRLPLLAGLALAGLTMISVPTISTRAGEDENEKKKTLPQMPRGLDEMLAAALRSNPDLLAAEAAVREAEAKLNQARLKVIEAVLTAYHEKERQEALLRGNETALGELKKRIAVGQAPTGETVQHEIAIAEARARLAQNDARLRYVLGAGGDEGPARAEKSATRLEPARPRPPIPERYRKLLDKVVSVNFGGLGLDQAITQGLAEPFGETVRTSAAISSSARFQVPVRETFENVPLRHVIQFLNDFHGITIVFRDYGILATTSADAARMNAPAFPEDLPLGSR